MNYVRSNSQSLKYQTFTPSYYTDIGVKKFRYMAKTHFLWSNRPEIKSWMFIYVYSFIKWEKSLKLKTLGNLFNSSEETIMFYFRTFPPVQQKNNPSLIQPPLSSSNLHLNLIQPHRTLIQPHLNLIQALYPSSKPSTFIQPPVPLSTPH